MHVTGIILAGGRGSRMKLDIPKQYYIINGKPLLYYTIKAYEESNVDDIVLVTGSSVIDGVGEREFCSRLVNESGFKKIRGYAQGGKERYDSVMNALKVTDKATDYVMVHDGARPCVSPALINRCIEDVIVYGSSVAAVPVKDTIKIVGADGYVSDTPDRSSLWQIQTPQSFIYSELVEAYELMKADQSSHPELHITDDSMVMERYGDRRVRITDGEYTNIKVTTMDDIGAVETYFNKMSASF